MNERSPAPRGRWWLVAGAVAGLAIAASGVGSRQETATDALPVGAVAVVDGTVITEADYARALAAVAADSRGPVDPAARRHVLDRLVDEALLVRGGLAMGLAHRDRGVRNALTAAVIELIVTSAEEALGTPGDAALKAFYASNRYLFSRPGMVHVRQRFFAIGDAVDAARERARDAVGQMRAGAALDTIASDPDPGALPDGLVPPQTLREYFGRSPTEQILKAAPGQTVGPLRSALGLHAVRIVAREPGAPRPFTEVRELVRRELVRRAGDTALRQWLDQQRAQARVTVAAERL